jgi:hypothetical protein
MGIDPPRHDKLATGIDFLCISRSVYICTDLLNFSVNAQYIGRSRLIGGHDRAALYQDTHG